MLRRFQGLFATAFVVLVACAPSDLSGPPSTIEDLKAAEDWTGAMAYYRTALKADSTDPGLQAGFAALQEQAVLFHIDRSRAYTGTNDFANAQAILTRGLLIVPDSETLRYALERVSDQRKARRLYRDAKVDARLGRTDKALGGLEQALALDPEFSEAFVLYRDTRSDASAGLEIQPIRLQSGAPVSLNFRGASFKDSALALGQAYGVNMIFDADLNDRPISVFAENITFTQAFELLLKSNRADYRRLGRNSVIVFHDDPAKRAEYDDYVVRTFFLNAADAQEMADTLARVLGIQNSSINTTNNSITLRDTARKISLVDRLLAVNDTDPAEVVLEVEILEVNRTKSEQLGLSFGSQITLTPPTSLQIGTAFPLAGDNGSLGGGTLTLPAATFRFFKQDVDARTLASPRIRTVTKREAQIHVGDQVPLRTASIIDGNGQTQTTFEYRDVGIKLNVTPDVRLDSSVAVDLTLEVSSLGQNLGTTEEPAYAIGTRNVSTRMVLEDGETAIIGGLIRDEDRDTIQGLPGENGLTSRIGRLFRARDGSNTRTDIILTLTPRTIRRTPIPSVKETEIFSGTGIEITDERAYDFMSDSSSGNLPTIQLDLSSSGDVSFRAADGGLSTPTLPTPLASSGENSTGAPVLAFSRVSYQTAPGDTVEVAITAAGFNARRNGEVLIRFRRDLVEVETVSTASDLPYRIDNQKGELRLELLSSVGGVGTREIARIRFKGIAPGLSYLIFATPTGEPGPEGLPEDVQLQSSRIVIR